MFSLARRQQTGSVPDEQVTAELPQQGQTDIAQMSPLVPDMAGRVQTGSLALIPAPSTDKVIAASPIASDRQPVIIYGSRKRKAAASGKVAKRARPLFVAVGIFLTLFVVLSSLAMAIPLDKDGKTAFGGLTNPLINLIGARQNEAAEIPGVAATATAVTQGGYDDGQLYEGVSYTGTLPAATDYAAAQLAKFTPGQCTYWANHRYHQKTGIWVPWMGHAFQWYYGALNYGWNTSNVPPNGPSILVMDSYTMGNGYYGHVAVVESVNNDGTVTISHWNWGPQNWGTTTYMTVPYPMAGLNYVWAP